MNACIASASLLLIGLFAGPVFHLQQATYGIYNEPEIIKILSRIFADWQGDKSERLVFITLDGHVCVFVDNDLNSISIKLADIIQALARKGQHLGTVTNIFHNHQRGDGFSTTDIAALKTLRKFGFTGEFQIFYPETRRIKTRRR